MSLYELEREKDVEGISEVLGESDKETIRSRAATILGTLPGEANREVVEALISAATTDDSKKVRVSAVESLSKLDEKDAIAEVITESEDVETGRIVELAARGLESSERVVRAASASLLATAGAGDPKVLKALSKAADDPSGEVRGIAVDALEMFDHPAATEELVELADDSRTRVREKVAEALAERKGNVEAAVIGLSKDAKPQVRRAAVSSLGKFGSEEAVEATAERLGDDSEPVRLSAAFSLVEALSNAPRQKSHEIREFAAEATEESAVGGETTEALADVLEAEERSARRNAAWLLGRVSEPTDEVVDSLVGSLADEDEMTGRFAAKALAEMGGDEVERSLVEAVEEDETQEMAVFALGELGGEDAAEILSGIVDETEDEATREKAFSALSKMDADAETHI